ncbi:MAG: PAS domain S-box protein, partial [Anaerolineae bacterium]|nr:PAS domain S-box protein [Anaerolineae bacterium]
MRDEDKTKEQLLSELHKTRNQLADLEKALSESGQTHESPSGDFSWATSLLSTLLDAVIIFDENQQIVFFNQSAEKIFGYQADEV